jgi:cytidylate kinase
MSFLIITLDGGAASGKSSTSRALAEHLDLLHVDTGSHYRSLTCALLESGCDAAADASLQPVLEDLLLESVLEGRRGLIRVNGRVYADEDLRSAQVNREVSRFAGIAPLRTRLLAFQRSYADEARIHGFRGLVMEGRDIGSVVFPDAPFRFFLEADPATRQERREREGLVDSISERDHLDSSRKVAPLLLPSGAEKIDSGAMNLDEVVAFILSRVEASLF